MSYSSVAVTTPSRVSLAARLRAGARSRVTLLVSLATLVLAWSVLVVAYHATPLAVPKRVAVRAALTDPPTARLLASVRWNRVQATAMDRRYEMLGFYRGDRLLATVTVGHDHRPVVLSSQNLTKHSYVYGANVANDPRVLAVLSLVFVLMTGVWPLWRLRNLDALAVASLGSTVILFNRGLLGMMSLTSYPILVYLGLRCTWWGLRRPGSGDPSRTSVPLFEHLTRRRPAGERLRVLRMIALAAAIVLAMVGLTSPTVIDIGYAVMEGATRIIHGVLPYGHIPDVLHGDTYPLGSYLAYTPFAWLTPVRNAWDNADAAMVVAVAAALFVSFAMMRFGRTTARNGDTSASMTRLRATIAWLTFPPLLVTVSTGTTDVLLAALLVTVLLLWRRPGWSTAALSGAVWFKLVPLALVPLLLARLRGRAPWRAAIALMLVSAVMAACLLALGGPAAPGQMVRAMEFQLIRGPQHTLWAVIGSVPFQQLAEAATAALIVGSVIQARRDPAFAENRERVAAVAAAVLVGTQIAASYWNYMYLVWAFPFIAVSLLADGCPARYGTSAQ